MNSETTSPEEKKAVRRELDRAEKGSAMAMIAAETRAVNDKTARLKALRLESERVAAEAAVPEQKKAPVRRRARKASPA
jgi:hypothetical protein